MYKTIAIQNPDDCTQTKKNEKTNENTGPTLNRNKQLKRVDEGNKTRVTTLFCEDNFVPSSRCPTEQSAQF